MYVYSHSWAGFRYYQRMLNITDANWHQGRVNHTNLHHLENDLKNIQAAKRVWLLISHSHSNPLEGAENERQYFIKAFSRLGRQLEHLERPDASLSLFKIKP